MINWGGFPGSRGSDIPWPEAGLGGRVDGVAEQLRLVHLRVAGGTPPRLTPPPHHPPEIAQRPNHTS